MTRTKSRFKAAGRNDVWFAGACLAALVVWGIASHAEAQVADADPAQNSSQSIPEVSGPAFSFNVAVTSDYVFRGVSQTEEDPALSGGVDLTSGSFYAGAWASNVSYAGDDETSLEGDIYAGVRPEVGGFALDFGVVGYFYDDPDAFDYDYVEFKAAASRAIGPATFGAAVFYSPDFFGAAEDEATYVEANAAFALADKWTVSGALGRQYVSSDFDYTTWNAGAVYALTDNLALDLRYHDTDEHDFGVVYESRVVGTLKATF